MTVFSFVLFIHVLSAITVCVALVLEGVILLRMRSAENHDQLRFPAHAFRRLGPIYGIAFAGILLGGIYLAAELQLRASWVPLALGATLLFLAVGGIVTGRRMSRIRRALDKSDQPFESLAIVAKSTALVVSYGFRAGLLLGILFLMSATPPLLASLLALGATAVAGVLLALRLRRISLRWDNNCFRAQPRAEGVARS
jgi:hypothetical protein